jgi:hypothetical protein
VGGPLIVPHVYNGRNRTCFFLNSELVRWPDGIQLKNWCGGECQRGLYYDAATGSGRKKARKPKAADIRDQLAKVSCSHPGCGMPVVFERSGVPECKKHFDEANARDMAAWLTEGGESTAEKIRPAPQAATRSSGMGSPRVLRTATP